MTAAKTSATRSNSSNKGYSARCILAANTSILLGAATYRPCAARIERPGTREQRRDNDVE